MTKEEKLKIIKELNDCFDEVVEPYLERLEKAEDEEAKACDGEKDYSQVVTTARGIIDIYQEYFDYYEATVNERD